MILTTIFQLGLRTIARRSLQTAAVVVLLLVAAQGDVASAQDLLSPRLAEVARNVTAGRADAVELLLRDLRGRGPLVEPIDEDSSSSLVSFLWRGSDDTKNVALIGGPPTGDSRAWLQRLGGTNLWYRTERIPNDARFVYWFHVDLPSEADTNRAGQSNSPPDPAALPDVLNPHTLPSGDCSLLELASAPEQPWLIADPQVSRGKVTRHSLQSAALNEAREIAVYTPPQYAGSNDRYPLIVLFDGGDCQSSDQIPVPTILDNLIHAGKLRPVVALLIFQKDRHAELACSDSFVDFTANELVPWARKNYEAGIRAGDVTIGGMSRGGMMAAYCALRRSDVFGSVLSVSGSYWWSPDSDVGQRQASAEPGWLTRQFVESRQRPIRFYLSAGRFEHRYPVSLLSENRRMRDVLRARNYEVTYQEFTGGHDPVCWRGPIAEGLIALVGTNPSPR